MKKVAIIVCAAGKGSRAGFTKNKLLVPFGGVCVLERTLVAVASVSPDEILVTASSEDFSEIAELCKKFPHARAVLGGETRFESVYRALRESTGEIVLVHDGARPFASQEIFLNCIKSVEEHGSGVCAVRATDTIALEENGKIAAYPPRERAYKIQTPQGFFRDPLICAYEQAKKDGRENFTDDSSVYAAYVAPPAIANGAEENVKLTHPSDFERLQSAERTGFGVDTHAFGKAQDFVVLCGVKIPSDSGFIAHSDGDVAVHAVMDALLSALGRRDIGYYFPDTDQQYKGADSTRLLSEVVRMMKEDGYKVKNLSVAIQAEKPRLSKYIDAMRERLALLLEIPLQNVGITAGTNEKLGYVGEGKGVTVYASVLLYRP